MLLTRKGYRVLVVDRATFPSDTVSTHVVQPLAVAALARWGLIDRLTATGCPPIHTYTFDFGPFTISGAPGTKDTPVAYCPRRTVLDKLLVDAAAEAGAEIREGFAVEEVLIEDGRVVGIKGRSKGAATVTERAQVIVGADGRYSLMAEAVRPEQYNEKPPLLAAYYTYWSGLPMDGRFETYIRPHRGFAAAPTHNGLTLTVGGWPYSEFETNKKDVEGNFLKSFDLAPEFADRVRGAKREAPFAGAAVSNFFRKPYGPGWALVGDAGYNRDPITAQGITDAFRDAERCAIALDQAFTGARSFDEAMREYQRDRDEHVLPMYEFTCQLATLQPPPPEMQQLLGAIHGNQKAMDGFAQMNAGTISPAEFGAIVAAAQVSS
jgi:2-polyprenyl-6-methoxyphenol hydroxylase-like FAD-dependent oxidoreductase